MSASRPVRVLGVVRIAGMSRGAGRWIRAAIGQGVFIDMPLMTAVKMPVVQIIDVALVFD